MKKIKVLQLLANEEYAFPEIAFDGYINFYIDQSLSYKKFLEKSNGKKSFYFKNNSIFLYPGKMLHLDFKICVGMPKGYYFQIGWPSIFELSELLIISPKVFYGQSLSSNIAFNVFNPTKHKIEIKLDEPFIKGAVYKGKNAKRLPIKDWYMLSGISRNEFFKKVEELYGVKEEDKSSL